MIDSAVFARDSLSAGARAFGAALANGRAVEDVEAWPDRIGAVTVEQVNEAARALAEKIADKSPKAVRLAKESLNGIELLDVKRSYRFEQGFTLELYTSPDSQEAREAFVEKRDTRFKD